MQKPRGQNWPQSLVWLTYLLPNTGKNDEESQIEGGKDGDQRNGGHVTNDRSTVRMGVEGGATILTKQVEPASHDWNSVLQSKRYNERWS